MANEEHLARLKRGVAAWNQWRAVNLNISPDLSETDLRGADLQEAHLREADLRGADLRGAGLEGADLSGADLRRADLEAAHLSLAYLSEADLSGADLEGAHLEGAHLQGTVLEGADLHQADLYQADLQGAVLSRANLIGANLSEANLSEAEFSGALLGRADLSRAHLVETNFKGASLKGCSVYGIAAWDVNLTGAQQSDLIITRKDEPVITVDSVEVAQFIYLLLHNEKIRQVIDTISKKGVLILGRFAGERKDVLDALRTALRQRDFLPMMFDFEKSTQRDFTETIMILAGLSLFVIADITNPRSAPLELQATVPDYMIPFVPIIAEGEPPFSMFIDLQHKFDWVLDVLEYDSIDHLLAGLQDAVIAPALQKHEALVQRRARVVETRHIQDYLPHSDARP
jgi:uncharacterized protein YjbI with pentapeptide repeats